MLDPTQGSNDEMAEEGVSAEGELYHGGGGAHRSMVMQDTVDYSHRSASQLVPQLSVQSSILEDHFSEEYDEYEEEDYHPPYQHPPQQPEVGLKSTSASATPAGFYESQTLMSQGRTSRPPTSTSQKHVPASPVKKAKLESASRASLSYKAKPIAESPPLVRQTPPTAARESPPMARPPTAPQANQSMNSMKKVAQKPPLPSHPEPPVTKAHNSLSSMSSQYLAPPEPQMPAPPPAAPPTIPLGEAFPQPLAPKASLKGGWQALTFAGKFKPKPTGPHQHTTTMRPPPQPRHPEELAQLGYQVNWMPEYDPTKPQWFQDEKKRAHAAAVRDDPTIIEESPQEDMCGFIDATQGRRAGILHGA